MYTQKSRSHGKQEQNKRIRTNIQHSLLINLIETRWFNSNSFIKPLILN